MLIIVTHDQAPIPDRYICINLLKLISIYCNWAKPSSGPIELLTCTSTCSIVYISYDGKHIAVFKLHRQITIITIYLDKTLRQSQGNSFNNRQVYSLVPSS